MPTYIDLGNLGSGGLTILGPESYAQIGYSVSSAGDFNGDGIEDVILSTPYTNEGLSPGGAYIIFGKAGGLDPIDLASLSSSDGVFIQGFGSYPSIAGEFVSSAGDVNGDGLSDIIIGDSHNDYVSGKVTVVFGRADAAGPIELNDLAASEGFTVHGTPNSATGFSASSAGDVNGDGYGDIVIGAVASDLNGVEAGAAYVIFGKSGGFETIELANLAVADGYVIQGGAAHDFAGNSVSALGDINEDGFDDFLIGAPGVSQGVGVDRGAAYVIYGDDAASNIDLANLQATDGFVISGAGDLLGESVSSGGDINGDGFVDIILGAAQDGDAYVIFGNPSGADIDLANLSPTQGFAILGNPYLAFADTVASAGDVNGDGFDDIVIGARLDSTGGSSAGAAYVFFGKADGFGTIDLSNPLAFDGLLLVGDQEDGFAGASISSAGDVNSDGFSDLLVGAYGNHAVAYASGAAYLLYGTIPTTSVTRIGTIASQTLAGGAFADQLEGRGGEDRLYGNGGVDTLLGGDGNDWLNGGAGADSMAGGADNDRYVVDNVGDVTTENADQGTDTVETGLGTGSSLAQRQAAQYQLAANIEDLVGTGVGQGLRGNDLDNHISAGSGDDFVNTSDGGADDVKSGDGRDVIYYGAALTGADKNDAGDEGGDVRGDLLVIQGDYDITLGTDALIDVEKFRILKGENSSFGDTGGNSYSYDITTVDANVAAGARVVVQGGSLQLGEHLKFNGAAETDGNFQMFGGHDSDELIGGAQGDHLLGRSGNDILTGNGGDDRLRGGLGADAMNGGSGADTFVYAPLGGAEPYTNAALESTGTGHDTITGFDFTSDKIDLPQTVSAFASLDGGAMSNASFDADLAAAVDATLAVNGAVLFTADSGDLSGKSFLVVDADGDGSYQADHDFVIQLVGATGTVPTTPDLFQ